MVNAVLVRLLAQRAEQETFIDQLLARVEAEERDLVDAERDNLTAARERIAKLDEQIQPLEEFEATRAAHRSETPSVVTRTERKLAAEPAKFRHRTAGHFLADYVRTLTYPGREEHPVDQDARLRVQSAYAARAAGDVAPGVHQTTADTPGLLPELIVGEIINDLDAARPFIASIGARELGTIPGKVFHRPVITQHTKVGKQAAEKAELESRDLKVDSITFAKETHGGWLNVSRQDIDWTDPSAWQAILTDLQDQYGVETEDASAAAFAATVTQTETVAAADSGTVGAWIEALYDAAVKSATAGGAKRASSLRLPNHIWTSVDMWAKLGAVLSTHRAMYTNAAGAASPVGFGGDILDVTRTMVPGLPAGTMIVGRRDKVEFYEQRIGLLQAIEPKVFGVEIAYGGYTAFGVLDPTAFCKVAVGA